MASIREISSLPLARSVIDDLVRSGFRMVADLEGLKPLDLCQEVKSLTPASALHVLNCAQKSSWSDVAVNEGIAGENNLASLSTSQPNSSSSSGNGNGSGNSLQTTAKDLLMKMGVQRPLITFCKEIDTMLGGGVMMGQLTEFCGVPGIGKTQLAIQLALDIQIPEVFNGNGGEAIYIDTEGSFLPERAAQMASELSTHLHKLSKLQQQSRSKHQDIILGQLAAADNMSMERFLEGISVFRCHDQAELLATIHLLPAVLMNRPRVKCIIIDSIAFHFRQDLQDISTRNRLLSQLAQTLNKLAFEHKLAVVVINHVTTKILRNEGNQRLSLGAEGEDGIPSGGWVDSSKRLVPALGEHWAHCVTNRVLLYWQPSNLGMPQRCAMLLKSPSMPPKTVCFAVTHRGVRDVPLPPVLPS